jgi:hypothetical protein
MDPTDKPRRPYLVPLGGYLGAGKTSLIVAASRVLQARGWKTAAVLNDQGSDLVDTGFALASGLAADQVTGGCFCCRFSNLLEAAGRLAAHSPDVIFAEAVGSCTDLAATVMAPLLREFSDVFRIAPFTVVVDPQRVRELLEPAPDSDLAFLFRKQIEEADLLCFSRADLYDVFPRVEHAAVRYLSAITGQGVAEWLDEILGGGLRAGGHILDIDYQRYARAEASLAWLNCSAEVRLETPLSPAMLMGPLLDGLDAALTAAGLRVAHLKMLDEASSGWLKASLVRNGAEPQVQGMLDASPAASHGLLLNIRAEGAPQALRRVVEEQLAGLPGRVEVRALECFSPAPPNPERR